MFRKGRDVYRISTSAASFNPGQDETNPNINVTYITSVIISVNLQSIKVRYTKSARNFAIYNLQVQPR